MCLFYFSHPHNNSGVPQAVLPIHMGCRAVSYESVWTRHSGFKTKSTTSPNDPSGQTSVCHLLQL